MCSKKKILVHTCRCVFILYWVLTLVVLACWLQSESQNQEQLHEYFENVLKPYCSFIFNILKENLELITPQNCRKLWTFKYFLIVHCSNFIFLLNLTRYLNSEMYSWSKINNNECKLCEYLWIKKSVKGKNLKILPFRNSKCNNRLFSVLILTLKLMQNL